METRRIELDEVSLAVLEAGSAGDSPLLLVHGFGGAKEDFADHLDALAAAGRHVVAPDLRGCGESGRPRGESAYSLEIFAADLLALVDDLGWRSFDLLGHSMGGMVVQTLVFEAADRVDRPALMDTGHGPVEKIDLDLVALAIKTAREDGMDTIADILADMDSPLTSPAGQRLLDERPGYREMGDRNLRNCSPEMYAAIATVMHTQDDRLERLRSLETPTLVMVGEQDKPFLDSSRRLAEAMQHTTLVVIAEAGHSPQFENPSAWFESIDTFFASSPTR
jgi:pimeloyl-ACP methyl ester carboxylesterase